MAPGRAVGVAAGSCSFSDLLAEGRFARVVDSSSGLSVPHILNRMAANFGFVGDTPRAFGFTHARLHRGRRAALDAAEGELTRYFEESLELLWSADPTGRLLRVNPAWKRCLGYPAETMCGRPLAEFIHEHDRDAAAAGILSLADGSRASVTVKSRYQTLEGGYVWLEWSARSSPADGMIHGFAHDISAQRRAEQQRSSEARRLEAMVHDRTRDLN